MSRAPVDSEQLLAMVAHDMRAPLRQLGLRLAMLQRRHAQSLGPEALADLQAAREELKQGQQLLEDMLAWAAGSPFLCLKALIGLEIDMTREGDKISLNDPYLPKDLDRLVIEGLPLGDHAATVQVERRAAGGFDGKIEMTAGRRHRAVS